MIRQTACAVIGFALLAGCSSAPLKPSVLQGHDPSRLAYTRLYCSADNESHFETATVELGRVDAAPPAPPSFAKGNAASRMVFAAFDARWGAEDLQSRKFHPAPAAQWVVYLEGVMSITVTDGETRHFGPGDVLRVEDTAPCKGHSSAVGDGPSFTVIAR